MLPEPAVALTASLCEFRVGVVDGKNIKRVAKRLKVLRRRTSGMYGGKGVVGLSLNSNLVIASELLFRDVCDELVAGDLLLDQLASQENFVDELLAERAGMLLRGMLRGRWTTAWQKASAERQRAASLPQLRRTCHRRESTL